MNFRSNKHFLVHFGGVRVAGGEKITKAVSDTGYQLIGPQCSPTGWSTVTGQLEKVTVQPTGSTTIMTNRSTIIAHQPVQLPHQPVRLPHQSVRLPHQPVHQKWKGDQKINGDTESLPTGWYTTPTGASPRRSPTGWLQMQTNRYNMPTNRSDIAVQPVCQSRASYRKKINGPTGPTLLTNRCNMVTNRCDMPTNRLIRGDERVKEK